MNKTFVSVLLSLVLVGCSEQEMPSPQTPVEEADTSSGKQLAAENCKSCHDMQGRGVDDDIPNLAAQSEQYLLKAMQNYGHGPRQGEEGDIMDVAEFLSEAEIKDVVAFYAGLPVIAEKVVESDGDYSYYKQGEALSEICGGCHGRDGNPVRAGVPRLAGQQPAYLLNSLHAYQDGSRVMLTMHTELQGLTGADLENISWYMSKQQPIYVAGKPSDSGRESYNRLCASCHGKEGKARESMTPHLAGQERTYLVKVMLAYQQGDRTHKKMQQTMADLERNEIEKIADHLASLSPVASDAQLPATTELLLEQCGECHNPEREKMESTIPKLSGQNVSYLINALTDYRDGERESVVMGPIAKPLSDAMIEGLATHYTAQPAR